MGGRAPCAAAAAAVHLLVLFFVASCQNRPDDLPIADAIEEALFNEAEDQVQALNNKTADLIVAKAEEGEIFQIGLAIGWILNPSRTGVPVPNFVPHIGPNDAEIIAEIFALAITKGLEKDGNSTEASNTSIAGQVSLGIAGGFEHALFSCEFAVQNGGLTELPPTTDLRQLVATKCCPIINEPLTEIVKDPSFKSEKRVVAAFEAALVETNGIGHPNIDVSLCDPYGKKDAEGSRIRSILKKKTKKGEDGMSG